MPITSVMCVMRRVPSLKREVCTNRSTALAICWRMERIPMLALAMPTITSRRPSPSRGVLAWIVVNDPSWPVFIACSTQGIDHQLTDVDRARAFHVRRTRFHARHVGLLQPEFRRVLDGHNALVFRYVARKRVEQRRLTGTRAAADQDVQPRLHAALQ